jgi:hypothetical protein
MPALVDMSGRKVARLTILERSARRNATGSAFWRCRCDCGNEIEVSGVNIRNGQTQSCGCVHITHGMTLSPEYRIWRGMHQRCTNPNSTKYENYGGRGITVCDRWRSFENFYADMGPRPEGLTIERINNEQGYGPGNCKWATYSEQNLNRRKRA